MEAVCVGTCYGSHLGFHLLRNEFSMDEDGKIIYGLQRKNELQVTVTSKNGLRLKMPKAG